MSKTQIEIMDLVSNNLWEAQLDKYAKRDSQLSLDRHLLALDYHTGKIGVNDFVLHNESMKYTLSMREQQDIIDFQKKEKIITNYENVF